MNTNDIKNFFPQIYLKLENLQPNGCFKIRGACNAVSCLSRADLEGGVYTASAGNFAQGLAYCTGKFGVTCDVFVPDHAPEAKLGNIRRLGGRLHAVTFDEWWEIVKQHGRDGVPGRFIHPVSDTAVIAGNAA